MYYFFFVKYYNPCKVTIFSPHAQEFLHIVVFWAVSSHKQAKYSKNSVSLAKHLSVMVDSRSDISQTISGEELKARLSLVSCAFVSTAGSASILRYLRGNWIDHADFQSETDVWGFYPLKALLLSLKALLLSLKAMLLYTEVFGILFSVFFCHFLFISHLLTCALSTRKNTGLRRVG